ncbi:MAG: Stk1 family PASTA domain-containing Ser/Thr kinase [Thermoleophilia bacterium]|nr:Stk1 family PASTA domain-containing Ser/Thr kinase [Thermoleophilia bacterium]
MATSDTLIDTVFDSRYRILERLGSGGMANVYLAEDIELGRRVAIKILNDRYAHDEQFVERFRREAKAAAALSHPNIVSIYDRGEAEGTYYIAMELIEGRNLKELIRASGRLRPAQAIAHTRQILAALRFAHRNGIVHRDIKPHNILIGHEERLKVADFGIARAGASQMTEAGSIMGTAQYLSPEQARGAHVTPAADIYSVGIVLYEMLTGGVPFTGDTPVEIAMKHLNAQPQPPSAAVPGIPADLDRIVLRALAKDPAERYATAEEMDSDLARVEAGLPVARETAESVTRVLARGPAAAPTEQLRPVETTPAQPPRRPPAPPYDPYGSGRPPRRKRSLLPWLIVSLLLAAASVAGWYVYREVSDRLQESKPVAVPNVVGIKRELAVQLIVDEGLHAKVERRADEKVKSGIVAEQSPGPGTRISKGETVTIVVSTGVPLVEVPKVAGATLDQATAILADSELEWDVKYAFSDRFEEGTVMSQDPKPGEQAPQGSVVTLRVSKGVQSVAVPAVIGYYQDEATATLDAAGFEVEPVIVASTEPAGIVVDQSPSGGEAAKGSTVTISVSEGPPPEPEPELGLVPSLLGLDEATAIQLLTDAGFVPDVVDQPTLDQEQDNLVLEQIPGAETELELGSTVTIVVARAPF